MHGIIPLYKERGMTSFQCVSSLRKILGIKKIGHSGTLDPNVDGVLPICIGNATKAVDFLMKSGKVYQGSITLGKSTTTEDLDGEVIDRQFISPLNNDNINNGLKSFVKNNLLQIPPKYSAVRVNGKHLYEYARKGIEVERPKRYVNVFSFKQTAPSVYNKEKGEQTIYFEAKCGKGTYVRTLAVDFGKLFGIPAVMSNLTRTYSGNFDIDQTVSLKNIEYYVNNNKLNKILYPIDYSFKDIISYSLSSNQWKYVRNGGLLSLNSIPDTPDKILLKYQDDTKALYYLNHDRKCYQPLKMFNTK